MNGWGNNLGAERIPVKVLPNTFTGGKPTPRKTTSTPCTIGEGHTVHSRTTRGVKEGTQQQQEEGKTKMWALLLQRLAASSREYIRGSLASLPSPLTRCRVEVQSKTREVIRGGKCPEKKGPRKQREGKEERDRSVRLRCHRGPTNGFAQTLGEFRHTHKHCLCARPTPTAPPKESEITTKGKAGNDVRDRERERESRGPKEGREGRPLTCVYREWE